MKKRKSDITITFPAGGQGELLAEMTRAYLHAASPSCAAQRILDGINLHLAEAPAADMPYLEPLRVAMTTLVGKLRAHEDSLDGVGVGS